MSLINILVLLSAVLIIVIFWAVFSYRLLKKLRFEVRDQWKLVREGLEKRQNLLPNLIETVRKFVPEKDDLFDDAIKKRAAVVKEYYPTEPKLRHEIEFGESMNRLINLIIDNKALSEDTNFLELRKEIDDLERSVNERSKTYNLMADEYNGRIASPFFKIFALIFSFHKANIFRFQ